MSFVSLLLPPGIQRNATPYDTPGRWWDLNMVRFQSGTLRPVGGWQRITTTTLNTSGTANPARIIYVWRDNTNNQFLLTGTDQKLYAEDSNNYVDITPTGFTAPGKYTNTPGYGTGGYGKYTYGDHRPSSVKTIYSPVYYWSLAGWGEDVILTASSDGRLYYYDSAYPTTAPTLISTAKTGNVSVVVTNERHAMAIGCDGVPRRVGWSSREDYTDWNFASVSNTAGYIDVDSRTPLVRGIVVREGVLIFSSSEAYLARYQGLPYIYGIDRVADTTLICPTAVAAYNGKAAWMGKNGFWKYEGGYLTPLDCPILNDIFANIDPLWGPRRAHAVHNGTFPEIWFFYPEAGNSECNRVVIWNYMEDWWSQGEVSRSAGVSGETQKYPVMGGIDGHLYEHENGWTDAGLSRVGTIYAESGVLPIGDGSRGIHINQVLPANGHGYNSMTVKFYSKQTPEGNERVFGSYAIRPDGYMDCRVSGRDVRMRIEASQDADWSIGKFRMNVEQGTGR